ncbi:MAG TPA: heparinase II/III family protein [Candidatus Paceibacterota bacterium]|nr:MAG: hypothetical protein UY03_C0001G0022 [Parcubacteria group bacterium GW2011_GWA2_47_64]KKU96168.1 MAG: hypothetical protein UY29_C0015G0008 [Parcubacteria group bacterium GW2011_GWC2_48_17]HBV01456.1 hypothetical protein [Candidatus Taylorbacteria bacterium]
MTILKKKQLHVLATAFAIALVVFLLYPIGNRLLLEIRGDSYKVKSGKEVIYSYIDKGDIRVADEILNNNYELSRFSPVKIDSITWKEDHYSDIYWRFNFYNLEPVRNLLFAWEVTGNSLYKYKLIEIVESFINKGLNDPYSWDNHGAAFRTMTLVNVWSKLHRKGELPGDLSFKILWALRVHGDFLANPAHFEGDYNHGLDQSAALYLLAVNFPDMVGADAWLKVSSNRINALVTTIIDGDGVLVENSPYYHFYVLEKFWEINTYAKKNHLPAFANLDEKIDKMISYAATVLQPDLTVPTIGASLQRKFNLSGIYADMAKSHPDLLFVLTKGTKGKRPTKLNIHYPVSGQTILRSGWGKGKNYAKQTQLIFDVGSYRTDHSDLDALSFNLYSNGLALMPDAGLYTYEDGSYRSYFHGTKSHNTVVVDGKDQSAAEKTTGSSEKVYPGFFEEGDGYVYQSGEHELYQGVSHERAIAMIEDSTILIFDNLKSSLEHTYEQMFHLFGGAEISVDGLTLTAKWKDKAQSLTIRQFNTDGVGLTTDIGKQNPPNGLCSFEYKVAVPCYSISYLQKGNNASYVTAISIGKNQATIHVDRDSNLLNVQTKNNSYSIRINETKGAKRTIEVNKGFDIANIYSSARKAGVLNAFGDWYTFDASNEDKSSISTGTATVDKKESILTITPPANGSDFGVGIDVNLDLSHKNIYFKVKVNNTLNLQDLKISLSNEKWRKQAEYNVRNGVFNIRHINRDGEWFQFGVAKSDLRKTSLGTWVKNDPTFNWSRIDGVKFTATAERGKSVTLDIKEFTLVPDQREARAVIFFDDGWSSVLDAAKIMNKYGMKGNIPVITGSIGKRIYLSLDNLKTLQNVYGWNIVNHTSLHEDATEAYVSTNNLEGYENDVVDALQYLVQNNINSGPNWFVYPDGNTGGSLKEIVGKYYKFARATIDSPELFPFAEPLEVKIFSVYSDRTSVKDVHNAISDAKKNNQTLMLMFHKFSEGTPSVYTEWPLGEFEVILKYIKEHGIKVVTLSELDKENGIPETKFTVHNFVPQQLSLDISVNGKADIKNVGVIDSNIFVKSISTTTQDASFSAQTADSSSTKSRPIATKTPTTRLTSKPVPTPTVDEPTSAPAPSKPVLSKPVSSATLPYLSNGFGHNDWDSTWGDFSIANETLNLSANDSTTGASAFLRGSNSWQDYAFKTTVDWLSGGTVTLFSRYHDSDNYVACSYVRYGAGATLVQVVEGERTTLAENYSLPISLFTPWLDTHLGMSVKNNHVECLINGEVVLRFDSTMLPSSGGVGLEVWNQARNSGRIRIKEVSVDPP